MWFLFKLVNIKQTCKHKTNFQNEQSDDHKDETIKVLTQKIDQLEKVVNLKAVDKIDKVETNLVYIIQLREHLNTNIFKYGMTNNSMQDRMKNYPKGSQIITTYKCKNTFNCDIEKVIQKRFNEKFINKDLGKEYVECDYYEMYDTFYEICKEERKMI